VDGIAVCKIIEPVVSHEEVDGEYRSFINDEQKIVTYLALNRYKVLFPVKFQV